MEDSVNDQSSQNDDDACDVTNLDCELIIDMLKNGQPKQSMVPSDPEVNTVYLLKKISNDYKLDPWVWCAGPNKKLSSGVVKHFDYTLVRRDGKKKVTSNNFRRIIYSLPDCPNVLVLYIGDKSIARVRPHGNSKNGVPFIRISKETIELAKSNSDHNSVKKQYEKCKKETSLNIMIELNDLDKGNYERHHVPRNTSFIKNCRKSVKAQELITHDVIYASYVLAKSELAAETILFQLIPDLVIILGRVDVISLTNRILKNAYREKQVLSYDTTFNMGNYYVSILVAKNTELKGDPIFPVIFMIHDKKHAGVHQTLWSYFIKKKLNINDNTPIVTDREAAIVKAVSSAGFSRNHLFCFNHFISDVKFWLSKSNAPSKDAVLYKGMVSNLLMAENEENFTKLLTEYKKTMSAEFLMYFEKNLEKDIVEHGTFFKAKSYEAFKYGEIQITNNISESLHNMLKTYQDRKKKQLPELMLDLIQFQLSLVWEFNRAMDNIGDYAVKDLYKKEAKETELNCWLKDSFVTEILRHLKVEEPEPNDNDAHGEVSSRLANESHIEYNRYLKNWTVRGHISGQCHCVELKKGKFTCSCGAAKRCFHILAVAKRIGLNEESIEQLPYRMIKIERKNARAGGKKKPRRLDKVIPYLSAPDSNLLSSMKHSKEIHLSSDSEQSTINGELSVPVDELSSKSGELSSKSGELSSKSGELSSKSGELIGKSGQTIVKIEQEDEKIVIANENDSGFNLNESLIDYEAVEETMTHTPVEAEYTEKEVPDNFTIKNINVSSLNGTRFLTDNVVHDFLLHYRKIWRAEEAIMVMDSLMFSSAAAAKKVTAQSTFVKHLHKNEAMNKDLLMVSINQDKLHWFLGLILWSSNEIIIYDSMSSTFIQHELKVLLKIAAVCHILANLKFDLTQWKCLIASDAVKQPNGHDCGVHTLYHAASIIRRKKLEIPESTEARKWIKYVLSKAAVPITVSVKSHRVEGNFSCLFEIISKKIDKTNITVEREVCFEKIIKCLEHDKEYSKCSEPICRFDIHQKAKANLCVKCRKWYHVHCHEQSIRIYFLCSACEIHSNLYVKTP